MDAPDQMLAVRVTKGANWFYWIAGLSTVNSLMFAFGANLAFVAGLGFTLIADAFIDAGIQQGAPSTIRAFAILFDLIFIIGFALAGYYANKRFTWVFVIGLIVYAADALIVLALGDIMMALFHAWALFNIVRGFLACRQLQGAAAVRVAAENLALPLPPPPPQF